MSSVLDAIRRRNTTQQRRVVEGKQGEVIDVPEGAGLLITGVSGCTVRSPGRSTSVTVERCNATKVHVGSVVASLELIHCTDVQVFVERCRTITVDVSKNVSLSCGRRPPSDGPREGSGEEEAEGGGIGREEEAKFHPRDAAEEASAIRLFTSSSEGVSINFEGCQVLTSSRPGDCSGTTAAVYHVPTDWRHEEGDGPRSVSRILVDRGSGDGGGGGEPRGKCKTLRCDQYGIPLEEVEAAKAGVPWTWERGMGAAAAAAAES